MNIIPFFLVWNPLGRSPTVQHQSHDEAKTEALRLATLHPGSEFFVFSVTGRAKRVEHNDWTPALGAKEAEPPRPSW